MQIKQTGLFLSSNPYSYVQKESGEKKEGGSFQLLGSDGSLLQCSCGYEKALQYSQFSPFTRVLVAIEINQGRTMTMITGEVLKNSPAPAANLLDSLFKID